VEFFILNFCFFALFLIFDFVVLFCIQNKRKNKETKKTDGRKIKQKIKKGNKYQKK